MSQQDSVAELLWVVSDVNKCTNPIAQIPSNPESKVRSSMELENMTSCLDSLSVNHRGKHKSSLTYFGLSSLPNSELLIPWL